MINKIGAAKFKKIKVSLIFEFKTRLGKLGSSLDFLLCELGNIWELDSLADKHNTLLLHYANNSRN